MSCCFILLLIFVASGRSVVRAATHIEDCAYEYICSLCALIRGDFTGTRRKRPHVNGVIAYVHVALHAHGTILVSQRLRYEPFIATDIRC